MLAKDGVMMRGRRRDPDAGQGMGRGEQRRWQRIGWYCSHCMGLFTGVLASQPKLNVNDAVEKYDSGPGSFLLE
jgi:hypothetical protein